MKLCGSTGVDGEAAGEIDYDQDGSALVASSPMSWTTLISHALTGGGNGLRSSSPLFCLELIGRSVGRRRVIGQQPRLAALNGDGTPYLGAPTVH
ncbi:hypothetical protein ACLOJK_022985 [Asimina triloba]